MWLGIYYCKKSTFISMAHEIWWKKKKEFRNMHCFPTPKCYNLSSQGNWFCWNYIRSRTKQIVKKLNPFWLTIYGHLIFDFIASCLYMWPHHTVIGKERNLWHTLPFFLKYKWLDRFFILKFTIGFFLSIDVS